MPQSSSKSLVLAANLDGHIPALDGVRGIAILLVLLFHFGQFGHGLPPPSVLVDKVFYKAFQAGWVGVDLFFVLSGFLITGILYDSKGSAHYFRNFYARRCLRIFPLYYLFLSLFLLALPWHFPLHHGFQSLSHEGFWYWTYLSNVWIAYRGWNPLGFLDHFWSLAVEEQFYLAWPLLVLLLSRRVLVCVCSTAIVVAVLIRIGLWLTGHEVAACVMTFARMDSLSVGALLALGARGSDGFSRLVPFAWPTASLTGVGLAMIFVWRQGSYDLIIGTVGLTLVAFFFGSILVIALISPPNSMLGQLFASSGLVFFGRYSYAVYVFHHPILFFRPTSLSFEKVPKLFGSQLPAYMLWLALAICVSLILALLSWHLCEKQFLKLKRFFPYESRQTERTTVKFPQEDLLSTTSR